MSKRKTITYPQKACWIATDQDALRLVEDGNDKPMRFEMLANTGKAIPHWWWKSMVVDIAGIKFKKRLPVLKDHDTNQRVGFTEEIERTDKGLVARGRMLNNDLSQEIRADAAQGFPWQASVYLAATRLQVLRENEEATVNGGTFKGPGAIMRKSILREVTFTCLGADDDTSAVPLSHRGGDEQCTALLLGGPDMDENENDLPPQDTGGSDEAPASTKRKPVVRWKEQTETLAAIRREAADAATDAERQRCLSIMRACAQQQEALCLSLIESGAPESEALLDINTDLKERLAIQAPTAKPAHQRSMAKGNTSKPAEVDQNDALASMPEGEEKWAKQWETDPNLRSEFRTKDVWLAFKRHDTGEFVYGGPRRGGE